jgi:hypothetical protein
MFFFQRKKQPDDPPNVRLMKTMKFGGKDLEANRGGGLTDAQKRGIQRGQIWGAVVWWAFALFMGIPGAILLTQGSDEKPGAILLVLMAMLFIGLAFWQQTKTRKVLLEGRTASVSGTLTRRMDMVYTGKVFIPVFKVTVDDKTFTVGKPIHDSFIEGEHYTLYFVPETDQLMSAELTYDGEKEKRLSDADHEAPLEAAVTNLDAEHIHSESY